MWHLDTYRSIEKGCVVDADARRVGGRCGVSFVVRRRRWWMDSGVREVRLERR